MTYTTVRVSNTYKTTWLSGGDEQLVETTKETGESEGEFVARHVNAVARAAVISPAD